MFCQQARSRAREYYKAEKHDRTTPFATSRYSVHDFTWESGVALGLQLESFDFTSSRLNFFCHIILIYLISWATSSSSSSSYRISSRFVVVDMSFASTSLSNLFSCCHTLSFSDLSHPSSYFSLGVCSCICVCLGFEMLYEFPRR